jgi:type III restriction enzyme
VTGVVSHEVERTGDPYLVPEKRLPSQQAALVNGIRAEVDAWRANGYPGASDTTQRLLRFWFEEDHQTPDGFPFQFYFCQREAVETFIFLHEVRRVRRFMDLVPFSTEPVMIDPSQQGRARYVFKMATGSGKTKAMALCIAWSYFHALREEDSPMTPHALLIAPNIIVFERLREDFEDAVIFRRDPIVPPEWLDDFDFNVILQDELTPETTRGVLYLTNIHRLYEERKPKAQNPVGALVGLVVNKDINAVSAEELFDRIASHDRLLVLNDEAHHVHDKELEWWKTIERLNEACDEGVITQLDFSATPKDQQGILFREIVVDYPLAQAVEDGIVKVPVIGEIGGPVELPATNAAERYRQWIEAGVARWRKFKKELSRAGKRPILFLMAEDTQSANEIGDFLRLLPEFKGDQTLVIHTNKRGDIQKKELEKARQAAREVDSDESGINAIVSVLMLREGWDVRNVCVIVGLRSYTAAARILPEQTLGRGLRRMSPPNSGWDERVVVIEHDAFRDLWDTELRAEGLVVQRKKAGEIGSGATTVFVDAAKVVRFDVAIPVLSRSIRRATSYISGITLDDVAAPSKPIAVPDVEPDEYIKYRGLHLISKKVIEEGEFYIPYPEEPSGAVGYYTTLVTRAAGLGNLAGHFAFLTPLVRDYLTTKLFEQPVELANKTILYRLTEGDARAAVMEAFRDAINELSVTTEDVKVEAPPLLVSSTPAFLWSKQVTEGEKQIFNKVACDSGLESAFAHFLDRASDVVAYAKLTLNSRFSIEYLSSTGALRYYYPDFVVRLDDDTHLIVETKGLEDPEVARKDKRARRWCEDASRLTGEDWGYLKVPEKVFYASTASSLEQLTRHIEALSK